MFTKTIRVAAVVILGLLLTGPASAETREFPASPGQTLTLDLEAGGSINIEAWERSQISVTYSIRGKDADRTRIEFVDGAGGLKIISGYESRRGSHSADIDLDIKVPREFDIDLDSMGGSFKIEGVTGSFSGKTMGGALTLHDVRGHAKLTTMGGEISLSNSELDGYLKTYGGEVRFEDVVGNVKGSSMGGNVDVNGDTVQISTMGGEIEIDEAPEGASLHTMGGDIRVTDAGRFVDATTMGGDVVLEAVDGWVKATTYGGDVEVTLVGSGGDVEITSMSGDVVLTLPAGFSAEFDLELAYTKGSRQDYEIITDLNLQRSQKNEWDHSHGSPRKYIRATGTVGGGEYKVKIRTINGDIRVK